jgi:hypothetical protein
MFVLIITANAPTLRPVFRSIFGLGSTVEASYPLKSTNHSSKRKSGMEGSLGGVGARRGQSDTEQGKGYTDFRDGLDNTSVDRILQPSKDVDDDDGTNGVGNNGIVKTADFTVSYADRSPRR